MKGGKSNALARLVVRPPPSALVTAMPTGSSRNQTLSFLIQRFQQAGIRPRKHLGQNFLIDQNLQRLLLKTAQLGPDDVVLEVGTGTGSLTALIAQQAAVVVTVEVDRDLFRLAGEHLYELENVRMLHLDVLKNKNRFHPSVLEAVSRELATAPHRQFKLVSNLPYNVATPVLTNLLANDVPPRTMTATIQKELADRLTARPRTKDYGSLSVWVQSQCRVQLIRVMPPTAFWPRPKVSSAIVHIELADQLRNRIVDQHFFHSFVRAVFFHRRKFLRCELLSAFNKRLSKPQVDQIMARLGLDGKVRAEQLDVDTMLGLSEAVRAELGG